MRYGIMLGLAVAAASMLGCSSGRSVSTDRSDDNAATTSDEVGKVGLQLQLANGYILNQVSYTITGGSLTTPMTGNVPLNNSSEIQAIIGTIPIGNGYTIALVGNTVGTPVYNCLGTSSTFNITGNTTTYTSLHLQCSTGRTVGSVGISTDNTICAQLTNFTAMPGQVTSGNRITLTGSSSVDGGAPVTYLWEVDNAVATVENATSPNAAILCTGDGTVNVKFTVSSLNVDGGVGCQESQTGHVQCGRASWCGDNTCQSNETVCGCPADCTAAQGRCGDGCCSANESNDPTASNFCSADCGNLCVRDNHCVAPETAANCPSECGCNNDGVCDANRGESYAACHGTTNDCPCNGNGTCDNGETYALCPAECPVCNSNNVCEAANGETSANCSDCWDTRVTMSQRRSTTNVQCTTCASPTNTTGACATGSYACETIADATNRALCQAVFTCEMGRNVAGSGTRSCAYENQNPPDCWCGQPVDPFYNCAANGPATGSNGTPGVCVSQIRAAFPGMTDASIMNAFNDGTYPGGVANNFVQCLATNCANSCLP